MQPVFAAADLGELMLGHNGNLTNATWLRDDLVEQGVEFVTASDTEVLAKLIAHAHGRTWAQRVEQAFHRAIGAFTFTHAHRARPGRRARPASASARWRSGGCPRRRPACRPAGRWRRRAAALDAMGAQFVRDVEAGEIADDRRRRRCTRIAPPVGAARERLCVFEFVYLARPDSVIGGRLLYEARLAMGRQLALRAAGGRRPGDPRARLARSRPPSATRRQSGLPVPRGPDQEPIRGPHLHPARPALARGGGPPEVQPAARAAAGKRVVVVDDSIVRGTTTGADRGHAAPRRRARGPRAHPLPADAATRATWASTPAAGRELIAASHTPRGDPHADRRRLARLPVAGGAAGRGRAEADGERRHCTACFDGRYPIDVPLDVDKFALERG